MQPKRRLYEEELTGQIIGAAIEVHKQLGPGLLESTYQACLCHELELGGASHLNVRNGYHWSTKASSLTAVTA